MGRIFFGYRFAMWTMWTMWTMAISMGSTFFGYFSLCSLGSIGILARPQGISNTNTKVFTNETINNLNVFNDLKILHFGSGYFGMLFLMILLMVQNFLGHILFRLSKTADILSQRQGIGNVNTNVFTNETINNLNVSNVLNGFEMYLAMGLVLFYAFFLFGSRKTMDILAQRESINNVNVNAFTNQTIVNTIVFIVLNKFKFGVCGGATIISITAVIMCTVFTLFTLFTALTLLTGKETEKEKKSKEEAKEEAKEVGSQRIIIIIPNNKIKITNKIQNTKNTKYNTKIIHSHSQNTKKNKNTQSQSKNKRKKYI